MHALTVEQAQTFLNAALATPQGPVLAVALTTGMRLSNYLGLKWQDIDWVRQTVNVVRSIRRLNGSGASATQNVREAIGPSNCSVGLLLFFVICKRKRARTICVWRTATWSSECRRDSQSMPIVSRRISDQYSTSPACHASGTMICATRRPQSRWQPECRRKLFRSSSDTPARLSRWTFMLMCFRTCRTRLSQG
jgi:integrase